MYSPDKSLLVYDQDEWWSDVWNAEDYGRPFDFTRTFSEQFQELFSAVPHISLLTKQVENSYYTNFSLNTRNSYMLFGAGDCEDCMYGFYLSGCKDCVDGLSLYSCQWCYQGIASERCYHCQFFHNCRDCADCLMVEECTSCTNCILCFGLHQKEYYYKNQYLGKQGIDEIRRKLSPLTNQAANDLSVELAKLKAILPHRAAHLYSCQDCSGDMVFESKNCHHAFDTRLSEDSNYLCFTPKAISSLDATFNSPDGVEYCYEVCSTVGTSNSVVTFMAWHNESILYSMECNNCRELFGCVGLRHKQYCIFNRQYSRADYERLVPQIITHLRQTGEWGEFFPTSRSPFGYNETLAQDYFPLSETQALEDNFPWTRESESEVKGDSRENTASNIRLCAETQQPFRLTQAELSYYQRMNLEPPEYCFVTRHRKRHGKRLPRTLWERICNSCREAVETPYHPERAETILCDKCYFHLKY